MLKSLRNMLKSFFFLGNNDICLFSKICDIFICFFFDRFGSSFPPLPTSPLLQFLDLRSLARPFPTYHLSPTFFLFSTPSSSDRWTRITFDIFWCVRVELRGAIYDRCYCAFNFWFVLSDDIKCSNFPPF